MTRAALALLLSLFAVNVMANPVAASTEDACPTPKTGKATAQAAGSSGDPESETPHTSAASTTHVPVRVGTPRAVAPRWHSLLPGMFR
jgi:hypothetical protein